MGGGGGGVRGIIFLPGGGGSPGKLTHRIRVCELPKNRPQALPPSIPLDPHVDILFILQKSMKEGFSYEISKL